MAIDREAISIDLLIPWIVRTVCLLCPRVDWGIQLLYAWCMAVVVVSLCVVASSLRQALNACCWTLFHISWRFILIGFTVWIKFRKTQFMVDRIHTIWDSEDVYQLQLQPEHSPRSTILLTRYKSSKRNPNHLLIDRTTTITFYQ